MKADNSGNEQKTLSCLESLKKGLSKWSLLALIILSIQQNNLVSSFRCQSLPTLYSKSSLWLLPLCETITMSYYFLAFTLFQLITAPKAENNMYVQQRDEYLESFCKMATRKVSVITIFGPINNSTMKIDHFQLGSLKHFIILLLFSQLKWGTPYGRGRWGIKRKIQVSRGLFSCGNKCQSA